jgi:hypothetical protein
MICAGLDLDNWEAATPFLQKAIDLNRGEFDIDDIYQAIKAKDMQLWGIHDGELKAVMVTEIIIYPKLKRLRVVLNGGILIDTWLDVVMETLDRFKEAHGCKDVEILGRRGWVKKLAKYGYREYQTVTIKD